MDSTLSLKIHHYSPLSQHPFENDYERVIKPNKHRIVSLHLWDRIQFETCFVFHTIDLSFYRLESLVLHGIKFNNIIPLLSSIQILPHLFSLNISLVDDLNDANIMYWLIFHLPMLKYNKISAKKTVLQDKISYTDNRPSSSIEQLVIDHHCTLDKLYDILSFTSKLRRLTCQKLFQFKQNNSTDIPIKIFNLTHCTISLSYLNFDDFEELIKKVSAQLRLLRYHPLSDLNYLDAYRWERLISQHMPYLHTFQFTYHHAVFDLSENPSYRAFVNQFVSKFWIERRWLLNIQLDLKYSPPIEIVFSIQPYR